jgi:glycosyltransferase involved in cell wall biosynthesis
MKSNARCEEVSISMNKRSILFVATDWGPKYGGVNAFNTSLATAVAKRYPSLECKCLVLTASGDELRTAKQLGVDLIELEKPDERQYDPKWAADVAARPEFQNVDWWVGHDVFTTPFALALRNASKRGGVAAFLHASFSEYPHLGDDPATADPRALSQREIFPKATCCLGVGPMLRERLTDLVAGEVAEIIPGITEFYHQRAKAHIDAVIFGRLKWQNNDIKNLPLAVLAFADAIRVSSDGAMKRAKLTIVGLAGNSPPLRNEIISQMCSRAKRKVQVEIHGFMNEQDQIRKILAGKNLCIFPSWHEGFGLSGWEAVGAGIPLIISRNTGAYQLLDRLGHNMRERVLSVEVRGGSSTAHGRNLKDDNHDISAISDRILKVAGNLSDHLMAADELRDLLLENVTWDHTADQFCRALHNSERLSIGDIRLPERTKAAQEVLSPIEQELVLNSAKRQYRRSNYQQARLNLSDPGEPWSMSIRYQVLLLEAKIALRLNEHNAALDLARLVATRFWYTGQYPSYLEASGVENTVLRSLGDYPAALVISAKSVSDADRLCREMLPACWRDHSRTLSLAGKADEAKSFAQLAIDNAGDDHLPRAKAMLAMGEAFRHSREYEEAINFYESAIRLARLAAHPDCLLWSYIALADAHALFGNIPAGLDSLLQAERIIAEPERIYPLETLNARFTRAVIDQKFDGVSILIQGYEQMGVPWPRRYVEDVRSGKPKYPMPL